MTNNDILRKVRFIFEIDDSDMVKIFGHVELETTRSQISDWLKKEDDPAFQKCSDDLLALFLNGLIIEKRGKKTDGPMPKAETVLNNNIVFRKIKIALNLQAEEILDILKKVDVTISKHELSSFFRKPDHKHYRVCQGQMLRNFLTGLQLKFRPESAKK